MVGGPATGKTTIGRRLADYYKLTYNNLKQYCKKVFLVFDIKNIFFKKFKKNNIFTI